jgi:hypothetical protein
MPLVLIAVAVIGLAVLAQLFGHDSRESVRSMEQELASYGMTWDPLSHGQQPTNERATPMASHHDQPAGQKQERLMDSMPPSPAQRLDIEPSAAQ